MIVRNPPGPSNRGPTKFVRSMADYYSILAGAIRSLDPNTPAARRRLYDRARSALLSEMQKAYPPIARSEILGAQMALDTAIGQVEADACLAALEKSGEHVEWDGGPTADERDKEYRRSYQCVQPTSVAPASLIPSRMSVPCPLPANQNVERLGSLSGIRRLFRWRSTRSIETSEKERMGRDTWLTDLLERASHEEDEDYQDFTPKRASNRNAYPG
jgi:hypothetical protein